MKYTKEHLEFLEAPLYYKNKREDMKAYRIKQLIQSGYSVHSICEKLISEGYCFNILKDKK